jgi:hypothetical protein
MEKETFCPLVTSRAAETDDGITARLAFFGALVLQIPVYWVVALVQLEEIVKIFIMRRRFNSRIWARDLVRNL